MIYKKGKPVFNIENLIMIYRELYCTGNIKMILN
jgi:hypothetical protein